MPLTPFPNGISTPVIAGNGGLGTFAGTTFANLNTNGNGNVFFVDGDNGNDGFQGVSPDAPVATIGRAVALASAGAVIYVKARKIAAGGTDPVNYAETIIIPATCAGLKLIGVGSGVKQAAQPQIKKGSGSTALLTIRAPGCLIYGLTFNGGGATGGGILLDDDGSTKTAEGTVISHCFFKNCVGSAATNATTGGAVYTVTGGAWNTLIEDCEFYDNIGGIVCWTASNTQMDDLTIRRCFFGQSAAGKRDVDIAIGVAARNLLVDSCQFGILPTTNTNNNYFLLGGSSGANTTGMICNCRFACNGKTFKVGGDVVIPATVLLAGNWQETTAAVNALVGRTT